LCAGSSAQVRTPDQVLRNPDPSDWLTYGGSYNSQRYSVLKQVTAANASRLQAKWVYHVDGAEEGEVTPIVANGVMYISGFNRLDAVDARSGNIISRYQRQPASSTRQRGTAIYGDKVAKSLMPTDYDKRLTPDEFKDLMAFLTRQGMKPPPAQGRGGGAQREQ
ncbi:MAG TPA: hypothetical protein VFI62_06485, partial [Burkholderiales bacterium]|nr:hypothetical protein [Burkholderiales bacterium]